jgi:hypothetical protein
MGVMAAEGPSSGGSPQAIHYGRFADFLLFASKFIPDSEEVPAAILA